MLYVLQRIYKNKLSNVLLNLKLNRSKLSHHSKIARMFVFMLSKVSSAVIVSNYSTFFHNLNYQKLKSLEKAWKDSKATSVVEKSKNVLILSLNRTFFKKIRATFNRFKVKKEGNALHLSMCLDVKLRNTLF